VTASSNATENGASLATAISTLSPTPSVNNPAKIILEPGTYNLQGNITIPSYVSLEGAGDTSDSITDANTPTTGMTTIDDNGHNFYLAGNNIISNLVITNSEMEAGLYIGTSSNAGATYSLSGPVKLEYVSVFQQYDSLPGILLPASLSLGINLLLGDHLQVKTQSTTTAAIAVNASVTGNIELHDATIQTPYSNSTPTAGIAINLLNSNASKVYGYNSVLNGSIAAANPSIIQYYLTGVSLPANAVTSSFTAKCAYGTQYDSAALTLLSNLCQASP